MLLWKGWSSDDDSPGAMAMSKMCMVTVLTCGDSSTRNFDAGGGEEARRLGCDDVMSVEMPTT